MPTHPPAKFDKIAEALTEAIDDGRLPPDARLPSEHSLATEHGVSRPTARAALEYLSHHGLIYPVHGRGWFVRRDDRLPFPLLELDQGRAQAVRDVWQTWLTGVYLAGSAHLTVTVGVPPRHVRQHLDLPDGARCAVRRRVRSVEGQPVMVSTGYFPLWLAECTELARVGEGEDVDMQNPSPMALLHRMGHGPVHDEDRIGTRRPTREETDHLELPPGGTVLTVCRTSTDAAGAKVRCTADVIAGHRFYLTVEQTY